jgi:hypothetical protein
MSLVIKLLVAVVLFAGSLLGGLAATGRLNHEGTANIPLLHSLFPAPPAPGEGTEGEHAADGAPAPDAGAVAKDAAASPHGETQPTPADASHAAGEAQDPAAAANDAARKQKTGRSLAASEAKPDGGHGGGGEAAGGHGEPANAHGAPAAKDPAGPKPKADAHAKDAKPAPHGAAANAPEGDFHHLENSLAGTTSQYSPGNLFRFQGLPSGVTPEQINEAWQRVQGLMGEIERRKIALDQQEAQQREQVEDISRRQASLAKERVEIEQMHRDLDAKIQKFKDQVKMVRNDETAALKRNAQTLAAFEPQKAAELIEAQWKTDKGQDEVLKLLEFMEKDAVNQILQVLPPAMTQDVLKKRLRVSKEPAPSGKGG